MVGCILSGSTLCNEMSSSLLLPPGEDNGHDVFSDVSESTQMFTSFSSSDFEVVDDTDL